MKEFFNRNEQTFFVICPPGFEELTCGELEYWWPHLISKEGAKNSLSQPDFTVERGGVTFVAPLVFGLQYNFLLKTASRILLRYESFLCKDYRGLKDWFKREDGFPILGERPVTFVISSHKSQLSHQGRIKNTCRDAFKKFNKNRSGDEQPLYLRFTEDRCAVSIDTSGAHLHQRGLRPMVNKAPLRESLAAGLVLTMMEGESKETIAKTTLIDPMAGSGTLLFEAKTLFQGLGGRSFAFQNWTTLPKFLKKPQRIVSDYHQEETFARYLGFDLDCRAALLNQDHYSGYSDIAFSQEDLFSGEVSQLSSSHWVVLNPPFGERIAKKGITLQKIVERIFEKYSPEKVGILSPPASLKRLSLPKGIKRGVSQSFRHGGLAVQFQVFKRLS